MLTRRVLINCYVICVAGRKGLLNTGEGIKERVYSISRGRSAKKKIVCYFRPILRRAILLLRLGIRPTLLKPSAIVRECSKRGMLERNRPNN